MKSFCRGGQCIVCGKEPRSGTRYYNVQSCEACKQFFRRSVAERKMYSCADGGKCSQKQCRSCRMDKCLVGGMDPRLVLVQHSPQQLKYFAKLAEHKTRLLGSEETTTVEQKQLKEATTAEGPSVLPQMATEFAVTEMPKVEELRTIVENEQRLAAATTSAAALPLPVFNVLTTTTKPLFGDNAAFLFPPTTVPTAIGVANPLALALPSATAADGFNPSLLAMASIFLANNAFCSQLTSTVAQGLSPQNKAILEGDTPNNSSNSNA